MRTRCWVGLGLLAAMAAGTGWAEDGQGRLSGPVLGYVWNGSAAAIEPILGIPGSSTMGAAVAVGARLRMAMVSPAQDYALGVAAGTGRVLLVDLRAPAGAGGVAAARAIDGVLPGPARIALSPTGAAAVLYYQDQHSVQVVKGLPGAPAAGAALDAAGLPGALTAMAVSDQGTTVLLAVTSGESGGLYVAKSGSAPQLAAPLGWASAVRFLDNSGDALVADAGRNEIVLLRDVAGSGQRIVLAGQQDGIRKPVDVAAFDQNQRVVAAMAAQVALLGMDGGGAQFIASPGKVTSLARLSGDGVFRLSEPSGNPMVLLDAGRGAGVAAGVAAGKDAARVLFVPARAADAGRVSPPRARVP